MYLTLPQKPLQATPVQQLGNSMMQPSVKTYLRHGEAYAIVQEVAFKEAFWPLYGMDEAEPITFTNIALRVSFALLAAGISWLLYANAPDKGETVVCLEASFYHLYSITNLQLRYTSHLHQACQT